VRALVAPENVGEILAAAPSALIGAWQRVPETSSQVSKWADAIVIGPGLGKSEQTRRLVENILSDSRLPVLLDADALNVFDGDVAALGRLLKERPALITPHSPNSGAGENRRQRRARQPVRCRRRDGAQTLARRC